MSDGPTFPTRYRMPARVAAVFVAYFIYRFIGDAWLVPGLMVGFGAMLIMWVIADSLTLVKEQRSDLMQVGSIILGLGLIGVGTFLIL